MSSIVAFILAGGVGKRLSLLTRFRAKPAVPFAGRYRIIDFTLTNCVHSGITEVYVLTQYISRSLVLHLGIGKPWDLDRRTGGLRILHPHLGYQAADWYKGTADAMFQNLPILEELDCDYILILSGDHVYRMDYNDFLDFHIEAGRPASVGVVEVPRSLCSEFGIVTAGTGGGITKFEEKPRKTNSNLASMGIYVFDRSFIVSILKELRRKHEDLDFGKHVIPHLVRDGLVSAYRYPGFWLDIGTVKSYYTASLDLLKKNPKLAIYDGFVRPVLTVPEEYPPLVIDTKAAVQRSIVCNGCVIKGAVDSSVLSPGVVIERGATVEGSIILHNCKIKSGAVVRNAIIDKLSVVGRDSVIGIGDPTVKNELQPAYLDFGATLIGRKTTIKAGSRIGTNCLVCGSKRNGVVPRTRIDDGGHYIAADVNI